MPKGVHNGPRGGDFGGGRPRTNADLPPEKQRKRQVVYCSDEELARFKRLLTEWRKEEIEAKAAYDRAAAENI